MLKTKQKIRFCTKTKSKLSLDLVLLCEYQLSFDLNLSLRSLVNKAPDHEHKKTIIKCIPHNCTILSHENFLRYLKYTYIFILKASIPS